MMKPLKQPVPSKRIWTIVVGLGLVAGASALFWRPFVSAPDSAGDGATSEPAAEPTEAISAPAGEDQAIPSPEDAPPAAPVGRTSAEYDARLSALAKAVRTDRAAEPESRPSISALLESTEPMDQVAGLAQLAGLGQLDAQADWTRYRPEVVLAAVDLCAAQFGAPPARTLLDQWMADVGDAQTAAEMAHNLLIEAWLPYGGGSAALELMIGVNEPRAIFVGLFEFAVNSRLPDATQTEALIRLRDHVEPEAYREYVRECADIARENGDEWTVRADRLLERLDASAADGSFIETALAKPYPGMVEDLELDLRHGIRTGRVKLNPENAAAFRKALATLDESSLPEPDGIALRRLREELALGQNAP